MSKSLHKEKPELVEPTLATFNLMSQWQPLSKVETKSSKTKVGKSEK
jgi:hypothetical protein